MRPLTSEDPEYLGPHRLTHRLGAGGMGQVYLALSPGGFRVVVKTILPRHAGEELYRGRFVREVEAARQVGGFHTAPVVGADPWAEQPWIATAYVPGPTLSEAVREHGVWGEAGLRALAAALAEGLTAIHRQGLVHRDLKPANVILTASRPLIIDFGLARFPRGGTLTLKGRAAGTVSYMSPEQTAAGEEGPVGPASDVFSLGTVIVHAATGINPFRAGTPRETMRRIQQLEPGLGQVPEALRPVVRGCWAKDPGRRPTAEEVLERVGGTDLGEGWPPPHLPLLPEPGPELGSDSRRIPWSGPGGAAGPGAAEGRSSPENVHAPSEDALPSSEGTLPPSEHAPTAPEHAPTAARHRSRSLPSLVPALVVAAALLVVLGVRLPEPRSTSAEVWSARVPEATAGPAFEGFEVGWMSLSAAGDVTVTGSDGAVRTTGTDGAAPWRTRMVLDHGHGPNPLAFFTAGHHPGGGLTVATWHDLAMVWDTATDEVTTLLEGRGTALQTPAFDPSGAFLAVPDHDGAVFVLDTTTWAEVAVLDGVDQYAKTVFAPDGSLLAAIGVDDRGDGDDRSSVIQLWDTDGWDLVDELTGPGEYVLSAVFGPGGEHLVTAGVSTTRVFPLTGGASRELTPTDDAWLGSLAAHPEGDFVAGAVHDGGVLVWDPLTWETTTTLTGHGAPVRTLALSPDGTVLADGDNDGTVRVWDTVEWEVLHEFDANSGWTHSLAFSADGRVLAASSHGEVVLWRV